MRLKSRRLALNSGAVRRWEPGMNASTACRRRVFARWRVSPPALSFSIRTSLAGFRSLQSSNADFVQGHEMIARRSGAAGAGSRRSVEGDGAALFRLRHDRHAWRAGVRLRRVCRRGIAGGRRRARRRAASPREGWREEVMQALEADLAQFTVGLASRGLSSRSSRFSSRPREPAAVAPRPSARWLMGCGRSCPRAPAQIAFL